MNNLLRQIGHGARAAKQRLTDLPLDDPDFVGIQRWVERGARLVKKAFVDPVNFVDPSFRGSYMPLVQKLVQVRYDLRHGGVFSFASVTPGEGVSYVVRELAWEIARHTGEEVLVASVSSLSGLVPADIRVADEGQRTRVWRLEEAYSDSGIIPVKLQREVLDLLRTRFGYVLVDCPSLRASAAALPMAGLSDGALLVVGAGEARRDQVEQAQRLLEGASGQLLGLILNKRTYPVPRFLYQRL